MGVFVKGMKMPRHCGECGIDWCNIWRRAETPIETRPSDCPLVEVPIQACDYCHEDRDGYVLPLDKNAHIFWQYPDKLITRFSRERREVRIKYCPMCGRQLTGEDDEYTD